MMKLLNFITYQSTFENKEPKEISSSSVSSQENKKTQKLALAIRVMATLLVRKRSELIKVYNRATSAVQKSLRKTYLNGETTYNVEDEVGEQFYKAVSAGGGKTTAEVFENLLATHGITMENFIESTENDAQIKADMNFQCIKIELAATKISVYSQARTEFYPVKEGDLVGFDRSNSYTEADMQVENVLKSHDSSVAKIRVVMIRYKDELSEYMTQMGREKIALINELDEEYRKIEDDQFLLKIRQGDMF